MVTLSAFLLFSAISPLSSAGDYIFAPFRSEADAAHWIEGRIMGESADYRILRAEDVAYIDEAWAERRALNDGNIPANQYNVVTNRALRLTQFPLPGGRGATVPGYIREGPTLQMGVYEIESGAQLNTRIAKLNGAWCTLSNVYWSINYSNELTNPIVATNIVRNFKLLALATRMEREGLKRINRVTGGETHYYYDYKYYVQDGYPDSYDWQEYHPEPDDRRYAWSGSSEYYCQTRATRGASIGSIRVGDDWQYGISPDEYSYSITESVHTGAATRVTFDTGIKSEVVTTGGIRRLTSAKVYIPLSLSYSRNRYKRVKEGSITVVNTNFTQRFVYTYEAQGSHIVTTGATAWVSFDFDGDDVAGMCLSRIGMPSPASLKVSDLDKPVMYVDDGGSYRATEDNDYRSAELSISGDAIAVFNCTFKTAPP